MFSNFKDTFIKKPQYTIEPPQAVLDAISKDVPKGFCYIHDHEGMCRLETLEGFNLQSGKICLSETAKKVLPKSPTLNDIMAYAYNSQADIQFMPDNDGCFMINGEKIKAVDMVRAPMRNIQFENVKFLLRPEPFPEPFKLKIGCDEYEVELLIKRMPNNSIDIREYESIDDKPISIRYKLNKLKKILLTINVDIKKANNALEVAQAYHIYNAFIEGKGMINNAKCSQSKMDSVKKISEDAIEFWDKLVQIEKYFEIQFDISDGITLSDARNIEEIYRCFIEKRPYRNDKIYNSVKGIGKFEQFKENINNNEEIYFEFVTSDVLKLLGRDIYVKALVGIFGAMIDKKKIPVSGECGEFEMFLATVPQKKMYEAVMLFATDEQLNIFRESSEHINIMENAIEIRSLE